MPTDPQEPELTGKDSPSEAVRTDPGTVCQGKHQWLVVEWDIGYESMNKLEPSPAWMTQAEIAADQLRRKETKMMSYLRAKELYCGVCGGFLRL